MNSYELSRNFFDWCFENPEKVNTNHVAIYFFAVEHCNRLGWKQKFGFPSQMTMDALGIKKHQTYSKYFNELVDFGFFKLIEKSKNQYSANIISLTSATPKKGKALGKAIVNHAAKQIESIGQSTGQSKGSIDKPITNNQITINEVYAYFELNGYRKDVAEKFYNYYDVAGWRDAKGNKVKNWKQKAQAVWFKDENKIGIKKYDPTNPATFRN